MRTDNIPASDNDFAELLGILDRKLPEFAEELLVPDADTAALAENLALMRQWIAECISRYNAAKQATAARLAHRKFSEKHLRGLIKRIKGSPNYTPAIGMALGIVGLFGGRSTGATTVTTSAGTTTIVKPNLRVSVGSDGQVQVKFNKYTHSGILLYSRRQGEKDFVLLAKQLRSPVIDSRANLQPLLPEMREYMARFFDVDEPTGQLSGTVTITIPGALVEA